MFVRITKYIFNDLSDFEMILPFEVLPKPKELVTVTSTRTQDSKASYEYEPILKKVVASSYMNYPFYLIIETYSRESVEKVISVNKLDAHLLLEKDNTVVYKVVIEKLSDLLVMLPTLYVSGTDSLFNVMTEFDEIVCISGNQISLDLSKNPESKALCFLYDLQELCFLGNQEWQDKAFIKNHFLQGSVIVDDLEIEV